MSNIIEEIQNLIEKEFELMDAIYNDEEENFTNKMEIILNIRKFLSDNEYNFLKNQREYLEAFYKRELEEKEAETFVLQTQNNLLKQNQNQKGD